MRKEAEEGEARGHTGCPNSPQNEGSGWEPKEDGLFLCFLFGTLEGVPPSQYGGTCVLGSPVWWQEDAVNVLDQDSWAPSTPLQRGRDPGILFGAPTSVQQVTKGLLGASGCEEPSLARDEAEIPPDLGDLHGDLVTHESPQVQTFGP